MEAKYIVFEASGEIVRQGTCPENHVALQAGEGETVLQVSEEMPAGRFYVKDGEFREYPLRGDNPFLVFNFEAEVWEDPRTPEETEADFERTRTEAIANVNRISGILRSQFITVIPGQEMLYLLKEREAAAWLSAEAPALTDYPLIASEIGITAADADQVSQVYVNMAAMLRQTAAALETLRLGTVAKIEGASDADQIDSAMSEFLLAANP